MRYKDSIIYLESFWKFGIKLGLARIEHLLDLLDNPHKKFKSVHVAGTNGKGSVCVLTASVLKKAGYRTGLYTSPHLKDYTERIKINGKDISREKFARLITKVREVIEKQYTLKELPTEFELLTAAAFLSFAEEEVDIAVIETGLGGRLDSTNVIEPLACAITNVNFDHCSVLGKTLSSIAKEKAGIIKRGVPVVTACDKPSALKVIRTKCKKQRSMLITCAGKGADTTVERLWNSEKGQLINISSKDFNIRELYLPFFGSHQTLNAAVALALLLELRNFSASRPPRKRSVAGAATLQRKKFHISEKAFRKGFASVRWPARFQVIKTNPFVVLDGAHNPSGVKALFKELSGLKKRKLIAVVGILKDKDFSNMIKTISGSADLVIAVMPDNPRACPAVVIAGEARKHGVAAVVAASPKDGLKRSLKLASALDAICVCGSLFTCADILKCHI
ncbi:MAG: folylpolyglutamate synthase/dihydrofolate synthase family protein [Candidatus Margulisiibacteriota bacterium]